MPETENKITNFAGVLIGLLYIVFGVVCSRYVLAGYSDLNNWVIAFVWVVVCLGIWRMINRIPPIRLRDGKITVYALPRIFDLAERGKFEVHSANRREKAVFLGMPLPMHGYVVTIYKGSAFEEFIVYAEEDSPVAKALLSIEGYKTEIKETDK